VEFILAPGKKRDSNQAYFIPSICQVAENYQLPSMHGCAKKEVVQGRKHTVQIKNQEDLQNSESNIA